VQPFADRIPDVRWQVFEESSHMPHVEEKEACLAAVAAFLDVAIPAEGPAARIAEGIDQ
jgi:L-proline amide hydrolase